MSLPERIAAGVVAHSRSVLVATLLVTALIGAGAPMVDDDSSLDQFETDSPEAEAAEYSSDRFAAAGSENTTTVQVIARGDDVLTRESLLSSLRFQQRIRESESIEATLADENGMVGVENVVARRSLVETEAEELEAEAAEIENESEALEAEREELENESQALEERGEQLERQGERLAAASEELRADRAALERRTGALQSGLEEVSALQTEYDELNASYAAGNVSDEEYANESDRIEDELADAQANATAAAELDAEQEAAFRSAAGQVRNLTHQRNQLEAERETLAAERDAAFADGVAVADDPENQSILSDALNESIELRNAYDAGELNQSEYESQTDAVEQDAIENASLDRQQADNFTAAVDTVQNRTGQLNDVRAQLATVGEELQGAFEAGTRGVFADEFAALRERAEDLEARAGRLELAQQRLEERSQRLAERGDSLEERGRELENRSERLEEQFQALEERESPSLQTQIDHLESLNDSEFESAVSTALSDDGGGDAVGLQLMPTSYEPGSTSADARMLLVRQSTDGSGGGGMQGGTGDEAAAQAQLELRDLAKSQDQEYVVFGSGIVNDEIDQSMGDSLAIVGPLALLFVVLALIVAYRDLLDIFLGVVGIVLVLVWTFGFMGWAGIAFNQMFIAVPVLLIGLSIDYAIHVFMRHREQRDAEAADTAGSAMSTALAGVGVALVWVTATTVIGFLANLVSPIGPIREFGVVSAFGIVAALIVFGALIPAAKVEVDGFLEARGIDRRKRAFGSGDSAFARPLSVGAVAARRVPVVVLALALLLTAGGVYGASQVDTSFDQEDFLADSPPEWTQHLPGPLQPGEYSAKADLQYVNENFRREDSRAEVLIRGDVANPALLERVEAAEAAAGDSDVAYVLANGEPDVRSPLSAMEDLAARNESFNESFAAADTDGDGVPDRDVEALYDQYLQHQDGGSDVLYRNEDGEYESVRLVVSIRGDAGFGETTEQMREIAAVADDPEGRWSAIATGTPIVSYIVEQELLNTVLQSLLITLVSVFLFLTVAYRVTGASATLGAITLVPVALTVSWILGTMYLLGMPFNVLTGMITSLTIGLGVAYSIHVSSRYRLELDRQGSVWDAMETTVTGTGGALLGSAATTIGGFGVLAFAILPVLQQFGIITGLTILYAFLASVIVLPTLLVLWTRYFGPDVSFEAAPSPTDATAPPGASASPDSTSPGADGGDDPVGPAEWGDDE